VVNLAEDCPNCRRNQILASQMRGLADSIVMGTAGALGVPAAAAAALPSVVEAASLKVAGRKRRRNGWNAFLKRYVANYKRTTPKGRKSFGTLSREAARKWRRQNK
jgi:hypothetical protein